MISSYISYKQLLADDWTEYKLRKLRLNEKPLQFEPAHAWEVSYLAKKIHAYYPFISSKAIKDAITYSAESLRQSPYELKEFVKSVTEHLEKIASHE